jgi:hypothetical protein
LKTGTVFRWKDFPHPKIGNEIKARWFVCLGNTGILSTPIIIHFCTTTTSIDDFKPGGNRASHHYLKLERKNYPCFDADCLLDFDELPFAETQKSLEGNKDIEIKGELNREAMKLIYGGVLKSPYYSGKMKCDIHASLSEIGITGLRRP